MEKHRTRRRNEDEENEENDVNLIDFVRRSEGWETVGDRRTVWGRKNVSVERVGEESATERRQTHR